MIDARGIRDLLPHRYPMLLVDRVIELVPGERIVAIKAVSCNEPWYSRRTGELGDEHMAYPVLANDKGSHHVGHAYPGGPDPWRLAW